MPGHAIVTNCNLLRQFTNCRLHLCLYTLHCNIEYCYFKPEKLAVLFLQLT